MNKARYLKMQEQLGREPVPEDTPPDWEDFPANLRVLMGLYDIPDKDFFMEILTWLDQRAIKKSSDQLKKEYDKLKRQTSGKKL
jgi:hypothetical protein